MFDSVGRLINIGDTVVYTNWEGSRLKKGTVQRFTDQMIVILPTWGRSYSERLVKKYPHMVAVINPVI